MESQPHNPEFRNDPENVHQNRSKVLELILHLKGVD